MKGLCLEGSSTKQKPNTNPTKHLTVYQGLLRAEDGSLTDGRRMAAGFMAGVTEAFLIVTPCEVVKIRLQQQTGGAKDALKYKVCLGVGFLLWVFWCCVFWCEFCWVLLGFLAAP